MAQRVVEHALFDFINAEGVHQIALRGESVDVDGEELERGERFGAFVVAEPAPVPALVSTPEVDVLDEEDVEEVEPEGGAPRRAAPKEAWVDYAVTRRAGNVDEATARAFAESLTKAELVEQYSA